MNKKGGKGRICRHFSPLGKRPKDDGAVLAQAMREFVESPSAFTTQVRNALAGAKSHTKKPSYSDKAFTEL